MAEYQENSIKTENKTETQSSASRPPVRRSYRACLHCRKLKSRCDLGSPDKPNPPPCRRCAREGRPCLFAESKRGGRGNVIKGQLQKQLREQNGQPQQHQQQNNVHLQSQAQAQQFLPPPQPRNTSTSTTQTTTHDDHHSLVDSSTSSALLAQQPSSSSSSSSVIDPDIINSTELPNKRQRPNYVTAPTEDEPEEDDNNPVNPQNLAAASLQNPTDALEILALASSKASGDKGQTGSPNNQNTSSSPASNTSLAMTSASNSNNNNTSATLDDDPSRYKDVHSSSNPATGLTSGAVATAASSTTSTTKAANGNKLNNNAPFSSNNVTPQSPETSAGRPSPGSASHNTPSNYSTSPVQHIPATLPAPLSEIVSIEGLRQYVDQFFSRHHPVFPIVPYNRIPKNEKSLLKLAHEDLYLVTAMVVISSRHDTINPYVHEKSWKAMQALIQELVCGKSAGVGAVEALLLLSENIPRQQDTDEANAHSEENRMAWMLVGLAVRIGYMLGLDQKTFTNPGDGTDEVLNRERLAWTFCYIFDRHASIRTGKAFWSRGPGLCFQGAANAGPNPDASANFPSLKHIPGEQEDYASLIQAYVELTQTMTTAHDVLYPSKDRTVALVHVGEYYKILDEFVRSINGFRSTWQNKRWQAFPLTELVWINFHYLRLYIFAFAFQAHVQRARPADGVASIFPRGPIGSPDAKFIFESIDAATEILRICTEQLHPGDALRYLPARFYLCFSYAGVFLLKAVFCGAILPRDQNDVLNLLFKTIMCLNSSSTDEQHPGVRYARLLGTLMKTLNKSSAGGLRTPAAPGTPKYNPQSLAPVNDEANNNNTLNNNNTDYNISSPFSLSTAQSNPMSSNGSNLKSNTVLLHEHIGVEQNNSSATWTYQTGGNGINAATTGAGTGNTAPENQNNLTWENNISQLTNPSSFTSSTQAAPGGNNNSTMFDDLLFDLRVPDDVGIELYADLFHETDHFWQFVHPSSS